MKVKRYTTKRMLKEWDNKGVLPALSDKPSFGWNIQVKVTIKKVKEASFGKI